MFIRFYIFIVLITAQTKLFSQTPLPSNTTERIALDDALFPFYHGVASGDPTQNSVIIWTRLTTDQPTATLEWQVATDTFMQNVIKSGTVSTSIDLDYSVKVDVTDLQPNTFYFSSAAFVCT